jgi:phosphatidylinositol glycan class Q protein
MHVLGVTNPAVKPPSFDRTQLVIFTDQSAGLPRVHCPGEGHITAQIILFDRPSPTKMQYLSLTPISLALSGNIRDGVGLENPAKSHLVEKLRMHTVTKRPRSQKELALPVILTQINCSTELAQLLTKNIKLIGARQERGLSVSEMVVESASNVWGYIMMVIWQVISEWVYPVVIRVFVIGLICHRVVAEAVLQILDWRFRPDSAALKDVSATAQQVDIRLQQFCYWPIQYTTLRRRREDWDSVTDRHPDYIRFYNSLWLVANDVIIGIALGSYIIDNADWVADSINTIVSDWTVQGLQGMIIWLTDWPAGLKLNNELASFLGNLFLWVIAYWSRRSSFL